MLVRVIRDIDVLGELNLADVKNLDAKDPKVDGNGVLVTNHSFITY